MSVNLNLNEVSGHRCLRRYGTGGSQLEKSLLVTTDCRSPADKTCPVRRSASHGAIRLFVWV